MGKSAKESPITTGVISPPTRRASALDVDIKCVEVPVAFITILSVLVRVDRMRMERYNGRSSAAGGGEHFPNAMTKVLVR